MNDKSIGQANYEAYSQAQNGLAYDGTPIPQWDKLNEGMQQAWLMGAIAAAKTYITHLLDAAAAAEADAFLMAFFTKQIGTDTQRAAIVLNEFRKWRKELV